MDKILVDNYELESNKINKDFTISSFSDLHFSSMFKHKLFRMIFDKMYEQHPDFICVPGDIIDFYNVLDNNNYRDCLINFFALLGTMAPVIISIRTSLSI